MKTHATLENPCSCSCHRNGDEDPCKKCDPMKVPIRDWEKKLIEKLGTMLIDHTDFDEEGNNRLCSEEIIKIVDFVEPLISSQIDKAKDAEYKRGWTNGYNNKVGQHIYQAKRRLLHRVDKEVIGEDDKYPAPGNYDCKK